MGSFNKADPETLTWMLQTYLLLAYFEINCGSEAKSAHAFPHCINVRLSHQLWYTYMRLTFERIAYPRSN